MQRRPALTRGGATGREERKEHSAERRRLGENQAEPWASLPIHRVVPVRGRSRLHLWTTANLPQHPPGSCFSRDCEAANRIFCSRSRGPQPGMQPELGKPAGAAPGPWQPAWSALPFQAGWDPRGFPPNPVPRRAQGGTLVAFRPIPSPDALRAGPSRLSVRVGLRGSAGLAGRPGSRGIAEG